MGLGNLLSIILVIVFLSEAYASGFTETDEIRFNIDNQSQSFLIQAEVMGTEDDKVFVSELIAPNGDIVIKTPFSQSRHTGIPPYLLNEHSSTVRTSISSSQQISGLVSRSQVSVFEGEWVLRLAYNSSFHPKVKVVETSQKQSRELLFQMVYLGSSNVFSKKDLKELAQGVRGFYKKEGLDINFEWIEVEELSTNGLDLTEWLDSSEHQSSLARPIYILDEIKPGDSKGYSNCLPGFESQLRDSPCPLAMRVDSDIHQIKQKYVKVLAHELGHYLGLFHPCDDFGFMKVCDKLSDTHDDHDSLNLMNTFSQDFSNIEITAEQKIRLKSSPLIYTDRSAVLLYSKDTLL